MALGNSFSILANNRLDLDTTPYLGSDAVPPSQSCRKSGRKHRDKILSDYVRRRYKHSQSASDFNNSAWSADTNKALAHYKDFIPANMAFVAPDDESSS